jgi:Disulphide bond corrector protein DsbC
MCRISALVLSAPLLLALTACPKDGDTGGFGDAKPTVNDGMVRKPAEPTQGPPDFANALAVTPAFDKASGKLTVSLDIKPGFHAYAPGEEVGKPVELKVDAANGWMIDGAVTIPQGVTKDLGELGKSVILEGKVDLGAVVKGGTGELAGTVTVQVCTDKACDRPKPHAFRVPTA